MWLKLKETDREVLLEKMEVVVKDLQERKDYILEAKKNAGNENMKCVKKMIIRKEELIQLINQHHEKMVAEMREKERKDFIEELTIINEHLDLLENLKDNVDKEGIRHEEIKAEIETVATLERSAEDQLSSKVEYKLFKLEERCSSAYVERLYGHLEESTKYIRLEKKVYCSWRGID